MEISPEQFGHVAGREKEHVFVLEKAAYGLRDAPLLWHLRAIEVLKEHKYVSLLHDSCTFILRNAQGELMSILTLHVDDLLITAPHTQITELQEALSKAFGTLSLDEGTKGFKHFGVDIMQNKNFDHVTASQQRYIDDLKPIELPTRCLKTGPCPPEKITEFRALVSAIAWVGVTSPLALTSASLLQGCLPSPTWGDIAKLNYNLQTLKENYSPLQYHHLSEPLRIVTVSDSSFGNSGKYSQNGYLTMLCSADDSHLCGRFNLVDYKSNKSKRVATSTLHAEALAAINAIEGATFLQTYLLELEKSGVSTMQLLMPEQMSGLVPIVSATDCNDLYESLLSPAQTASSTKHLALYIAALREFRTTGRIQAYVWVDTRDMIANSLTKLKDDGSNEPELLEVLKSSVWKLAHAYKWNSQWCSE
jgi:hypothetical protein